MRIMDVFSVFPRKLASGKVVFYYQCYDDNGNRSSGLSTGQVTKTAARAYCMRLYREGNLFPHKQYIPTFEEYAQNWWVWDTCEYLKNQMGRKDITRAYADNCRKMVRNQINPYFGKTRLDRITSEDINQWLLGFKERTVINAEGKEEVKSYKNTYANTVFGTCWLMLNEAVHRGLINTNPATAVKKLKNDRKAIEIITPAEVRLLFPLHWETVWGDDRISYLGNKLAACTGMRASEILGLRGEYIYDEYIHVCAQHDEYGYRPTKTKEKRNIPLAPVILNELRQLASANNNGYVFSLDGGVSPVSRKLMYNKLHRALKNIGITQEAIKRRGLSMHSWRHFFNTTLQMANVALSKVQSVTGHKSDRMTEWYTHFDSKDFAEVRGVQESLLLPEDPVKNKGKTHRSLAIAKD
jgi:integrase